MRQNNFEHHNGAKPIPINLEAAKEAVKKIDSYNQSLRDGESCTQRRVPVLDIG